MESEASMQDKLLYQYYSAVSEKEIEWLWYPYIPYGKITLLQGDPGDGKSTVAIHLAAALTSGGILPDGSRVSAPVTVIYQCPEDGSSDTVKPRLLESGADCDRIAFIVDGKERLTLGDSRIEDAVRETGARMLILDPLQSFMAKDGEMQSVTRMRVAMGYLSGIAEKYCCAILLIGHMNKSGNGNALYRGLGSIDIAAAARSVLMITRDDDNPEIRYLFPIKSSLAPEGCAIGFLMSAEMGFRWIGKCSINTKDFRTGKRRLEKKEMAKELLSIMLSEEDMATNEIMKRMSTFGISSKTTRNAQKEMGVVAYKKKKTWYWKLPDVETNGGIKEP